MPKPCALFAIADPTDGHDLELGISKAVFQSYSLPPTVEFRFKSHQSEET